MYLGTDGNVGIGTTTPQAKLHVAGDAKLDGPLAQIHGRSLVGLAANANNDLLNNVGPTGNVYWYKGNQGGGAQSGGTQLLRLRDDGALLLGTTPRVVINSAGQALYA